MFTTSSVSIINVNDGINGINGQDGAPGAQGVGIVSEKEQWYLSTSSSNLTGGSWSDTEPSSIPSGKYLWGRIAFTMSNGTTQYSDAVYRAVLGGVVSNVDEINQSITNKVWQSDITTSINTYDGSTGQSIRDRVTQTESDISGITSRVSDVETDTSDLGTRMSAAESSITQNANNINLKVSKNSIISEINQSPEAITISANKVDLIGNVTFSMLDTSTQNKVNGSIAGTTMHYLATTLSSGVTRSTSGWTTTTQSITSTNRYLWTYQTITKSDGTTANTDPIISGVWGNAGASITVSSTETKYQVSNSGTTTPTGTWQSSIPSASAGQFLWTRVVTTFSDNSTATSYSVAKQGETGATGTSVTIQSTSTTYQSGTSGTTAPAGTWSTTIPSVSQGNYLWTKTVVTYSDGNSTTSYSVSYYSEDGDTGVGVVKVEQLYRTSNSTDTPAKPTSVITSMSTSYNTWTLAMPAYNASYPYYFTCTQTTYTDNNHTWTDVARSKAIEDANTTANNAVDTANLAEEKASVSLGMKVNYENFSTANAGECYLHGYTNGVAADVDGFVYWNDVKRTVPKKMLNPNTIVPYWTTVYIVLRLSSASATTGTLYMVWYNSGWKYAVTPTPSAVGGTWTWAETTDIVLGQFVEPSSEGQIIDAFLYDPPRNASHVQTTGSNAYQYAKPSVDWVSTNGAGVVTARSIINNWATDATSTTTTIKGGLIQAHTILAQALATDAIMSNNYVAISGSHFSSTGSYLDLASGNFYTPNFGVSAEDGSQGAYINGEVVATSGRFGNDTQYWNIETVYDYAAQPHASLVGTGSPYLQTGNWQVGDTAIATRKYVSTDESSGSATYYKDNGTNTFYDVGMQVPTDFTATAPANNLARYTKSFFYGRKYTGNTAPGANSNNWTYFYLVDTAGNIYTEGDIYEGGVKLSEKYAALTDVGSIYLPKTGGTVSGALTVSDTFTASAGLSTTIQIRTNLGSTSAATLTGNASAIIAPGVTGTLGVGNGGTGQTSAVNAANSFLNALSTGSSTPNDADYYISQYVGGGTTTTTYHRRPMSAMWNWIKGKIDSVYDIDSYRLLTDNAFDTIDVTDLNAGKLIVSGVGRFTNGIYGDLIGTATSVSNNLKIQLNSGTTEGTNQFTYNGSAAKNINITKSSIGLGNVDNTADANKSVNYATSAGSVTNSIKIQLNGGTTEGTNQFTYNGSAAKNLNITKSSIGLGNVDNTADANKSVASAGKISATRQFTVGGTTKNVDWSGSVSFSKTEISGNASTSAAGWMSAADKSKLDQINVSDITDVISASTIVGTGGVSVTVSQQGVATIKHANTAITAGTAQGTANGTTLTNGGTFTIPKVTYDAYGHITSTGTNTLTLPNVTSVSGNAGTATKFASSQSITLTGDTTGTASSQAGWSIATTTTTLTHKTLNSTTINNTAGTFAFSGSGQPWDGTDWVGFQVGDSVDKFQITVNNGGHILSRQNDSGGTNTSWGDWLTSLDSGNYTTYTVTKTGSGASGTWGISITGSAASATKATQDGDGATISSTYAKLSGATFTGAVSGTSFSASGYLAANSSNSGTAGGIALYGSNPVSYGIAMRNTTNGGKHGYVQGDWAIYSYMSGASSSDTTGSNNRGWILKNTTRDITVASVNGEGRAVFNGSVTIGGNTTNTSGMRMEYDSTLKCTNFVFY